MAELVDAPGSGSGGRKPVGVRVSSSAPHKLRNPVVKAGFFVSSFQGEFSFQQGSPPSRESRYSRDPPDGPFESSERIHEITLAENLDSGHSVKMGNKIAGHGVKLSRGD